MINETPETLLSRANNSAKLKKLAIILAFAGILICALTLLPLVQNVLFSFIGGNISSVVTGRTFHGRLQSLLSLPFFGLFVLVFALCCLFSKTIASFLDNDKNEKLIIAAATGTGILLLGYICVFSYQHGWQWLNSDNSSEMILGKFLAEENAIVSRNWYYGTEIHLIYQTLFTMPLFKLLGGYENWALIRALSILLNNLILIASYFFMARQVRIKTKWICITALFLIMPLSEGYWYIATFGGNYLFFLVQLFCCLGLFIRLADHSSTAEKALPGFILFSALSFALGVQGLRGLLNVHIPLLIACVFIYSRDARKKSFPLFLGCYGFVVNFIGFGVNYLLHFWYRFGSLDYMCLDNLFVQFFPKLGESLVHLAGFFGLSVGSTILSASGLFSVIAITGTFLSFFAVFKCFRQFWIQDDTTDKTAECQFMPVFFIVSVIFNIFVFITVDHELVSYYFVPFMVLYIPLVAILFQYTEKRYGHLKRTALISGIVLFIFGQSYLFVQNLAGRDLNSARKGYIQYLLDNRLDFGLATYDNSNITTELCDGKVEFAGLVPFGFYPDEIFPVYFYRLFIPVQYGNPSYHQGESFLLLSRKEWELAQQDGRSFARFPPDYEDGDFIIVRYPSAEIMYSEVLENR